MTEQTRTICNEAVGLIGNAKGITEIRVFSGYDDDLSIITAALALNHPLDTGRKIIVYTLGYDPCSLGVGMLEYVKGYTDDPEEMRMMAKRLISVASSIEFIGDADAARLADAVDVGLVIIDRINSLSLQEQACFYDGLLRYAEASGVPIISLRQFLFQKDDREFVIGGISRWLVDRMLEKTKNTIEL